MFLQLAIYMKPTASITYSTSLGIRSLLSNAVGCILSATHKAKDWSHLKRAWGLEIVIQQQTVTAYMGQPHAGMYEARMPALTVIVAAGGKL